MTKLLKSNRSDDKFSLTLAFAADRSNNNVKAYYRMTVPIKYLNTLRQSLEGLEQRWQVFYEAGDCVANDFFHKEPSECKGNEPRTTITLYMEKGDTQIINGRIVKLNNRDEILKKSSLSIPIPAYLDNFRLKTDDEIRTEKRDEMKKSTQDGVEKAVSIITAPIWLPIMMWAGPVMGK